MHIHWDKRQIQRKREREREIFRLKSVLHLTSSGDPFSHSILAVSNLIISMEFHGLIDCFIECTFSIHFQSISYSWSGKVSQIYNWLKWTRVHTVFDLEMWRKYKKKKKSANQLWNRNGIKFEIAHTHSAGIVREIQRISVLHKRTVLICRSDWFQVNAIPETEVMAVYLFRISNLKGNGNKCKPNNYEWNQTNDRVCMRDATNKWGREREQVDYREGRERNSGRKEAICYTKGTLTIQSKLISHKRWRRTVHKLCA